MDRDWDEVAGAVYSVLASLPRVRGTRWMGRHVVKISVRELRRRLRRRGVKVSYTAVALAVRILESRGLVRVLERRRSGVNRHTIYSIEIPRG